MVAEQVARLLDRAVLGDLADEPRADVVAGLVVEVARVLGREQHADAGRARPPQEIEHRLLGRR
jgi:hypothetical protein